MLILVLHCTQKYVAVCLQLLLILCNINLKVFVGALLLIISNVVRNVNLSVALH